MINSPLVSFKKKFYFGGWKKYLPDKATQAGKYQS